MEIDRWRERLKQLPLGDLYLYEEVGSTNLEAERLAEGGAPPLSLVVADSQIAGRGRLGRTWITQPGQALAFSWILYPQPGLIQSETLGRLNGLGALAVVETLREGYALPAQIKWPNDVLVEDRKIAGILAEAHWEGCQLLHVILGLGINIHQNALPADASLAFPATTLEECLGRKVSRLDFLVQVLQALLKWHRQLAEPSLIKAWNELLAYRGQQIALSSAGGTSARGELLGIDEEGALILRTERGEKNHILSGEIQVRLVDRS